MSEGTRIKWKISWRDEYSKSICVFANAHGGVLIGGGNDQGQAVGVADAVKLLEYLPNKVRDALGIIVTENCHE